MKFKLALMLLVGCFSLNANASVAFVDVSEFRCSNGDNYDVVRQYWGGWGPGKTNVEGFCNKGILNQKAYNGRHMPTRNSHPDIARCQDEDTQIVRTCFAEFRELNGLTSGEIADIKHGRAESTSGTGSQTTPTTRR